MNKLIINCGSSSLKISFFEEGACVFEDNYAPDISLAFIKEQFKPDYIGHRFVHGGDVYRAPVKIDSQVMKKLEKLVDIAPLHNGPSLKKIKECKKLFKNVTQYAVFDTDFHKTLPEQAYLYAISPKYKIRRYGFHGISYQYLISRIPKKEKMIALHLGNGCSITAIKNGKSVDTSMGYTPSEGLVMGTRAGDFDWGAEEFLGSKSIHILNHESGLLGLSGISSKMDILLQKKAKVPIDVFCYRIVKYIGAYIAILEGVDAIVFTGGIGENSPEIRKQIIDAFKWFGIKIKQPKKIKLSPGDYKKISPSNSSVEVYVFATDENRYIASILPI